MLTVGSLFAGIGGFDLGLERTDGFRVRWQVENNHYCQRVLAHHWPDVTRYGDIRDVDWSVVEPVDLLCGGFPCQDISQAGKRAGIEGARSGLWKEFQRAICALRPRFVLVENVSALRSRGLSTVLADLAESGYDAEWDCIPASAVGAPHRRDRIWIIAYPKSYLRRTSRDDRSQPFNGCDSFLADPECMRRWQSAFIADSEGQPFCTSEREESASWLGSSGETLAYPDKERQSDVQGGEENGERDGFRAIGCSSWWYAEPDVGRVAHGVPHRVDRLRGLGNAVVPQIVEYLGHLILAACQEQDGDFK